MIPIPEKYQEDLKVTRQIIRNVEATHKGLENLTLFSTLADLGNLAMLGIGINGTGKSTVAEFVKNCSTRNVIMPHGLSPSGLKYYGKTLNHTSTTVIVEDLAKSGSDYMRIATISLLSGLAYTHFLSKHSNTSNLEIEGCTISALIYGQPLIIKVLVQEEIFESDIRDKCLRFYQLVRPLNPSKMPIRNKYDTGKPFLFTSIDRSNPIIKEEYTDQEIVNNLRCEVSHARAEEHCNSLLKASAVLNNRSKVTPADIFVLQRLTKVCLLENYIYTKTQLEGARTVNENVIPLLTSLLTYPENTIESLTLEYQLGKKHLGESRTRQIIEALGEWVYIKQNQVLPTPDCQQVLEEVTP